MVIKERKHILNYDVKQCVDGGGFQLIQYMPTTRRHSYRLLAYMWQLERHTIYSLTRVLNQMFNLK